MSRSALLPLVVSARLTVLLRKRPSVSVFAARPKVAGAILADSRAGAHTGAQWANPEAGVALARGSGMAEFPKAS
jgi:hypothetical protein